MNVFKKYFITNIDINVEHSSHSIKKETNPSNDLPITAIYQIQDDSSKRYSLRSGSRKQQSKLQTENETSEESRNLNIGRKSNSQVSITKRKSKEISAEQNQPSKFLKTNPLIDELNAFRNLCIEIHEGIEQDPRFISQFEKCKTLAEKNN